MSKHQVLQSLGMRPQLLDQVLRVNVTAGRAWELLAQKQG